MQLNTIKEERALDEIGSLGIKELVHLSAWLAHGPLASSNDENTAEIAYRAAPSLSLRSEIEILGLSVPRFAYRAYVRFQDRLLAIVNTRRVNRLAKAIDRRYPTHKGDIDPKLHLQGPKTDPRRHFKATGDSLLAVPGWLIGCHVLTTELGSAYGEESPFVGTPYMRHIRYMGGGVCAQAVCYQATALLHKFSRGVYGIAEITALASGDNKILNLGGMNIKLICQYFENKAVGLRPHSFLFSDRQSVPILGMSSTLRAYVLSGFPVIMHSNMTTSVDIYRQIPPEFCAKLLERLEHRNAMPHCVVLVGAHPTQDKFVINDPAVYPFLVSNSKQIFDATAIHEAEDGGVSSIHQFVAILPQMVTVPLRGCNKEPSLIDFAMLACRSGFVPVNPDSTVGKQSLIRGTDSRFILLNFGDRKDANERCCLSDDYIPSAVVDSLYRFVEDRRLATKWCWVQYVYDIKKDRAFVWVWDAEQALVDDCPPSPLLVVAIKLVRNQDIVSVDSIELGRDSSPAPTQYDNPDLCKAGKTQAVFVQTQTSGLQPGLITSCDTAWSVNMSKWMSDLDLKYNLDLYVMMQSDADVIVRLAGRGATDWNPVSAVEFMSAAIERSDADQLIDRYVSSVSNIGPRIVSLSSFVPEIASEPHTRTSKEGWRALSFLFLTAIKMHEKWGVLKTVELVAGSCILGFSIVLELDRLDTPGVQARRDLSSDVFARVRGNLTSALEYADCGKQLLERGISLCFELEPGPLFAIRDWETINEFCASLPDYGKYSDLLGVNLDIAHWRLAGIEPYLPELKPGHRVFDRICHAHISGHHRCAHFGDIDLGVLNSSDEYRPWIELLDRVLLERHGCKPQFSGTISHEYEAASSTNAVNHSLSILSKLLGR